VTKTQKGWIWIGFILIALAFILPITTKIINFYLDLAKAADCKDLTEQILISFKGTDIGVTAVLVASGLLCILPISEWFQLWRKRKE